MDLAGHLLLAWPNIPSLLTADMHWGSCPWRSHLGLYKGSGHFDCSHGPRDVVRQPVPHMTQPGGCIEYPIGGGGCWGQLVPVAVIPGLQQEETQQEEGCKCEGGSA
jgi:hypothetical protein